MTCDPVESLMLEFFARFIKWADRDEIVDK